MPFDVDLVRAQFPALASAATFFDNPGGTQVAKAVVDRMVKYLTETNANHGGAFRTSIASDAVLEEPVDLSLELPVDFSLELPMPAPMISMRVAFTFSPEPV